jgi:hypothetical protein
MRNYDLVRIQALERGKIADMPVAKCSNIEKGACVRRAETETMSEKAQDNALLHGLQVIFLPKKQH